MPTQLNGRVAEMDEIITICQENNILLIEDSAGQVDANEQMRIAESIEAAAELCAQRREQHASFDIPCPDDSPYKGFVDGQTAFREQKLRGGGSSSDDDSSDDGF